MHYQYRTVLDLVLLDSLIYRKLSVVYKSVEALTCKLTREERSFFPMAPEFFIDVIC